MAKRKAGPRGLLSWVDDALEEIGLVDVTAAQTPMGTPTVEIDSVVAIQLLSEGEYAVILIEPENGAYEEHGRYHGPHAFEIALSEAVEHLARYQLLGEHLAASEYASCEYEDCDGEPKVEMMGTGQKFCAYHGAMVAVMNVTPAADRVEAVREAMSVPEWRKFKRAVAQSKE